MSNKLVVSTTGFFIPLKILVMNPKGKFITGVELTEAHIGSKVTYVPQHAEGNASHPDCENGHIKSWNDGGVFVQYAGNTARTDFKDLVWG